MAELTVHVSAIYDEVIECRNELKKVEQEMKNLKADSSPQEVNRLMSEYNRLYQKWEDGMERLGKIGAYTRNAMDKVSEALENNVNLVQHIDKASSNMIETISRRAKAEQEVNDALQKQREELYANRDATKATLESKKKDLELVRQMAGSSPSTDDLSVIKDYEDEYNKVKKVWDEINDKITIYDSMLNVSSNRLKIMADDINKIKSPFDGMDGQNALVQLRSDADVLIESLSDAGDKVSQLQDEMTQNGGGFFKRLFAGSDDIEKTSQKVSEYKTAVEEAFGVGDAAMKAQQSYIDGLVEEMDKYEKKIAEATDPTEIQKLQTEFANLKAEQTAALGVLNAIKETMDDLDKSLDNAEGMSNAAERFKSVHEKLERLKDLFKDSGAKDMGSDVGDLEKKVKSAGDTFTKFYQKAESDANSLKSSLKQLAGMAGIAFGIRELGSFVNSVMSMREYFQDIESSMKVFLGSAEKGAEFTQKLKDYAYYNMFEFKDLAQASQQMISYGHNVESIIPRLDQLSNVATGTHGSLMELVDAYNRAKATGVVDARGVQSWAVKGVMIRDVLRDMGETAAGTTITFEQLNKVLDKVTGEGGQFHNLMLEMMDNISAEKGQLEDNLASMYNEIGEKFEGVIVKWYKLQSEMVDNYQSIAGSGLDVAFDVLNSSVDYLRENLVSIINVIKDAVVVWGTWKVAIAALTPLHKLHTWWVNAEATAHAVNTGKLKLEGIARGQATAGIIRQTQAQKMLNATVLASPWTWAAAALTGFVYACYSVYTSIVSLEDAQKALTDCNEQYADSLKESKQQDLQHYNVIKDKTASLVAQTRAYKDLITAREIFSKFSKEEIANMSSEQFERLWNQDASDQIKKNKDNQVKALEEIKRWVDDNGLFKTSNEYKDVIGEIARKNNVGQEYIDDWKGKVNYWNSWDIESTIDNLLKAAKGEVQSTLEQEIEDGVVEGMKNGLSNHELTAILKDSVDGYANQIESETKRLQGEIEDLRNKQQSLGSIGGIKTPESKKKKEEYYDLQNQINNLTDKLSNVRENAAENFKKGLVAPLEEAEKKVDDLNHKLLNASEGKKANIEMQLKAAEDDLSVLKSTMSFFDASVTNKQLVIDVQTNINDAILGDEKLIEIGDKYKEIDDLAVNYLNKVEDARKEMQDLGTVSGEEARKIAQEHNITAESIEMDFGTAYNNIKGEIDELNEKLEKVSDPQEERKIKLEIAEKEEQLNYIENIKTQLSELVQNPFNLRINIIGKAEKWLRDLLGIPENGGKGGSGNGTTDNWGNTEWVDNGLRRLGIQTQTAPLRQQSQTAQQKAEEAKERNKPEKKPTTMTGKQWQKKRKSDLQNELKEINDALSKPIDATTYENLMKRKSQVESELKKSSKDTKEALQRRQKDYDLFLKNREQQLNQERKTENASEEARIAEIENNTIRERAERENRFRLEEQQIKEQIEAFKKANVEREKEEFHNKKENKDRIWADSVTAQDVKANGYKNIKLTRDQQKQIDAMQKKYDAERKRYNRDVQQEELNARIAFLKQYGDIEEQRLAITQEYNQKIAEEQDPYKKAELMIRFEEELSKVNAEDIRKNINWEAIFQDITNYDVEFLRTIKGQLENAIKDGIERGVQAADLKALGDKLQEVKDAIADKDSGLFGSNGVMGGSWLGRISQMRNKQNQLEADADRKRAEWQRAENEATKAKNQSLVDQKAFDDAISKFGKESPEAKAAEAKAAASATKATQAANTAQQAQGASQAANAAAESNGSAMGFAITDAIIHGVNDNLQSANKMIQDWGIGDDDFQEKFAAFAESSQYATDAFDSLKSGDIAGVVYNLGNAFSSLGESFGLWSNSNRESIMKANDKLANEMTINTQAIDRLTKAMEKQTPGEAYQSYEQALRALQTNEEVARQTMLNNVSIYDHGHSLRYEFNDKLDNLKLLERIADYLKLGKRGVYETEFQVLPAKWKGYTDFTLQDFLHLDAATMNKLYETEEGRKLLEDLLNAIYDVQNEKNYIGLGDDILKYINTYSEDVYKELQEKWLETATSVSFDSLYDSFVSSLMDMDKSAKEFSEDFETYLRNAIYNSMLNTATKTALEKWQKAFAYAMKKSESGQLSKTQVDELMKSGGTYYDEETKEKVQYEGMMAIRESAVKIRETIEELGLYNGKNGSAQSASVQAMERITTDQAEELIGRMNAGQIIWEQQRVEMTLLNTKADQLYSVSMESRDIASDSRDILAGMAIHVEEIRDGVVDTIVPRIKNIDDNLYRVKNIVEKNY